MVRVLCISQHFFPEHFRINEVVRSLVELGVDVVVLTGQPNYPSGKIFPRYKWSNFLIENIFNATVCRVPTVPRGQASALALVLNFGSFVFFASLSIFKYYRLLKNSDVIYVYGVTPITQCLPAILFKFLFKTKIILNLQDLWPESVIATGYVSEGVIAKGIRLLVKFCYRRCDLILASSPGYVDHVNSFAPGVPVRVMPNSADIGPGASQSSNGFPSLKTASRPFSFIYAGNLGRAQGLDSVLRAFALLEREGCSVELKLYGDGSEKSNLMALCDELSLNSVHFCGTYKTVDTYSVLSKADALLLSLKKQELLDSVLPNKLQVYMAVGRPIFSVGNSAVNELIQDVGCGVVAETDSADEIFVRLKELVRTDQQGLVNMGVLAQNKFQHCYAHDVVMRQLHNEIKILSK